MRYVKVLIFACLIFLALVFSFQNQAVFATKMELNLDLFFIPPMKSISLPFYFILFCAFLMGVLMSILLLVWDRLHLSARIMKDKWQIQSLSSKLAKAESLLHNKPRPTLFARIRRFFSVEEATPVRVNTETVQKSIETVATNVAEKQPTEEKTVLPAQNEAKQTA